MSDHITDAGEMVDRLPYQLTEGVTATLYKLTIDEGMATYQSYLFPFINASRNGVLSIPWPDAAERLRYREGEPWCYALRDAICTGSEKEREILDGWVIALHRLAAILCDDAEAFRVLHWCVTHFGQEAEDE